MEKFEFKEIITNTIELDNEDLIDYLEWCDKKNKDPKSKYSLIEWVDTEIYISDWLINEDTDYEICSSDLKKWIEEK